MSWACVPKPEEKMAEPLCRYFGKCGGCTLQHLDHEVQLRQKLDLVKHATGIEKIEVFSGDGYHYRNRQDFFFAPTGIGLRQRENSSSILRIEECVISEPRINEAIREINSYFKENDYYNLKTGNGTLMNAIVRISSEGSGICFVLNDGSSRLKHAVEQIEAYAAKTKVDNIAVLYKDPDNSDNLEANDENFFVLKGAEYMAHKYLGFKFFYPIEGFFQNNHTMAEKMQEYCREKLSSYQAKNATLLDLYGGVGTFGIINSHSFKEIHIIDFAKKSIDAAKKNIVENRVHNASATAINAKQLKKIPFSQSLYVISDPPRSGMDNEVIQTLNMLKPNAILYISCNPEQLSKELPKFKNYIIKSVAMFDMFPQTNHVEAIAELVLNKS